MFCIHYRRQVADSHFGASGAKRPGMTRGASSCGRKTSLRGRDCACSSIRTSLGAKPSTGTALMATSRSPASTPRDCSRDGSPVFGSLQGCVTKVGTVYD